VVGLLLHMVMIIIIGICEALSIVMNGYMKKAKACISYYLSEFAVYVCLFTVSSKNMKKYIILFLFLFFFGIIVEVVDVLNCVVYVW